MTTVVFACQFVSEVCVCECLGFCALGGFGFAWVFFRAEECFMRVTLLVGCSSGGGISICGSSSTVVVVVVVVVVEVVLVVMCRVWRVLCGRSPLIVTSTHPFLPLAMSRTRCLHLSLPTSPLASCTRDSPGIPR